MGSRYDGKGTIDSFGNITEWSTQTAITTDGTTKDYQITSDNVSKLAIYSPASFIFGWSTSGSTTLSGTNDLIFPGGLAEIQVPHKLFASDSDTNATVFFHLTQDGGATTVRIVEA